MAELDSLALVVSRVAHLAARLTEITEVVTTVRIELGCLLIIAAAHPREHHAEHTDRIETTDNRAYRTHAAALASHHHETHRETAGDHRQHAQHRAEILALRGRRNLWRRLEKDVTARHGGLSNPLGAVEEDDAHAHSCADGDCPLRASPS